MLCAFTVKPVILTLLIRYVWILKLYRHSIRKFDQFWIELQYSAGSAVHYFGYEHWCSSPESPICFFLFVLFVFAIKIMTLAIEATTLIRHLACDPELFGHGSIQFFTRLVHYFRTFDGIDGRWSVRLGFESCL